MVDYVAFNNSLFNDAGYLETIYMEPIDTAFWELEPGIITPNEGAHKILIQGTRKEIQPILYDMKLNLDY